MDLYEIEGKNLLRRFDIPTDDGILFSEELRPEEYPFPCVVKGQALAGKRGKAGAVRFADNFSELVEAVRIIRQIELNGKKIDHVMVAKKLEINQEYYIGLTLDTENRKLLLMFSPKGGMNIEEVAAETPDEVFRFDCTRCFPADAFRQKLTEHGFNKDTAEGICCIAEKLTNACLSLDATTIEINPLAVLKDGSLVAVDAKVVLDDNALYRQSDYIKIPREAKELSGAQKEADEAGLVYVELNPEGTIGLIAGGAGIGMATVDTIEHYGGTAYNFLDLGGGVTAEKMYHALHLLLKNPQVKDILVNVFGGINNCAVMAEGIEKAWNECDVHKHIVVKSRGFNQEEGWAIYDRLNFPQIRYGTTDEAVKLLLSGVEKK